jgi:hypothetical protein
LKAITISNEIKGGFLSKYWRFLSSHKWWITAVIYVSLAHSMPPTNAP